MHNHIAVLLLVWSLIVGFSFFEFSAMHTMLNQYTYIVIFIFLFFYYLFSVIGELTVLRNNKVNSKIELFFNLNNYRAIYFIFILLSILNIILSGYIPIVSMITTGDSKYAEFGITGIYGFYLAYSTALGILSLYLYFELDRKRFLYHYFIILFQAALVIIQIIKIIHLY